MGYIVLVLLVGLRQIRFWEIVDVVAFDYSGGSLDGSVDGLDGSLDRSDGSLNGSDGSFSGSGSS